jgi:cell division protein FtsZ
MGDEVRVTVIAAGFDRWEEGAARGKSAPTRSLLEEDVDEELDDEGDDDFDVPSFLK